MTRKNRRSLRWSDRRGEHETRPSLCSCCIRGCAREVCTLTRACVRLGKRSGTLTVHGKRNKYREVPLNATAQAALAVYDPTLAKVHPHDMTPLFRSEKRDARLTERGLGYLVKKYAEQAKLRDVSPHD